MRYSQLFHEALSRFPSPPPALDIQLLMERAFNLTRTRFWTEKEREISDPRGLALFRRLLNRRLRNEPIHYILKEKEFHGYPFCVSRSTLIPRPETELLVEHAHQEMISWGVAPLGAPVFRGLDIGTGSGVVAITLARLTGIPFTATDLSPGALRMARQNAARHQLTHLLRFIQADLFPPPSAHTPARFSIIVSNPPYIPEPEWRDLEPHVRDHEPKMALTPGESGLEIIARIVDGAPERLTDGGLLLMEMGCGQERAVRDLLERRRYREIVFYRDYSDHPRIARARWREAP